MVIVKSHSRDVLRRFSILTLLFYSSNSWSFQLELKIKLQNRNSRGSIHRHVTVTLCAHMVIRMAVHDKLAQLVMDSCQAFVDGLRGDQQQVGNALKRHCIIVEAVVAAN